MRIKFIVPGLLVLLSGCVSQSGYSVKEDSVEWGGSLPGGGFFSAETKRLQVKATLAGALGPQDGDRAAAVATAWCESRGQTIRFSDNGSGLEERFEAGTWHLNAACG